MTSQVLLGSDNGYIVKRRGANSFEIVYEDDGQPEPCGVPHGPFKLLVSEIFTVFNDQEKVVALTQCGMACEGAYQYLLSSADKGETWPTQSFISNYTRTAFLTTEPPFDADGHHWTRRPDGTVGLPTTTTWAYSPDWQGLLPWQNTGINSDSPINGNKNAFPLDGQMWQCRQLDDGGTVAIARTDLVTGATQSYNEAVHDNDNKTLRGYYGTNKIILWKFDRIQALGHDTHFLVMDVSNIANPAKTWIAPFRSTTAIHQFQVLTDNVIVALAFELVSGSNPSIGYGSIWRSEDGGFNWDEIVPPTSQLQMPDQFPTDVGSNIRSNMDLINLDHTNPSDVWIGTVFPYVYHSIDAGLTWEVETVSQSLFPTTPPTYWFSVGCVPEAAVGRLIPMVTLIGAT